MLVKTGSPVSVGLVGFCRTIPMFIFGLILGAAADRFRRTNVLVAVQTRRARRRADARHCCSAFGVVQVWQMYLLTGVIGCAWATDFSTRRALISELHARERVVNALSLESMSMQSNKILATLLSGIFLAVGGATLCYWWLTAIYALNLLAILRVRQFIGTTQERQTHQGARLVQLIKGGWSISVRTPVILGVLLITVVMNLLVFPYQQMLPVIARDLLHVGPKQLGILAGADGIGAIVVGMLLTRRAGASRHGLLFLGGAFTVSVLVIVLAMSRIFALSWGTQVDARPLLRRVRRDAAGAHPQYGRGADAGAGDGHAGDGDRRRPVRHPVRRHPQRGDRRRVDDHRHGDPLPHPHDRRRRPQPHAPHRLNGDCEPRRREGREGKREEECITICFFSSHLRVLRAFAVQSFLSVCYDAGQSGSGIAVRGGCRCRIN